MEEKLFGLEFNTFDELKVAIFKGISKTVYVNEFHPGSQAQMRDGNVPFAPKSLKTGTNKNQIKYNIHHIKPVEDGGDVYNLDNLIIVAPKTHNEIHAEIDAQKKEQNEVSSCKKKPKRK